MRLRQVRPKHSTLCSLLSAEGEARDFQFPWPTGVNMDRHHEVLAAYASDLCMSSASLETPKIKRTACSGPMDLGITQDLTVPRAFYRIYRTGC